MDPNIFLIDPKLGPEDTLTAYWHYLLNVVPGLGQAFVAKVCRLSGLAPSKFVGAIDHPRTGDRKNHPDLLVQCSDYDLIFEHKLDSRLGSRQLHKYLDFAKRRHCKLALLAAKRIEVDGEVKQSRTFVYPKGKERPSHFLWQDLYPILGAIDHHLTREFSECLENWGLGKFSWAKLGNPFIDDGAASALLTLYDSIRPICEGPNVQCRKSGNSLIYQIRTPFAPVHLVNVGPLQSVAQESPTLREPVMGLWVWIRRGRNSERRVLSKGTRSITRPSLRIEVCNHVYPQSLPKDHQVFNERSYYVPLKHILRDSLKASEKRLVLFVRAAVGHLRKEIADLPRRT
jgi:hypothetical protein